MSSSSNGLRARVIRSGATTSALPKVDARSLSTEQVSGVSIDARFVDEARDRGHREGYDAGYSAGMRAAAEEVHLRDVERTDRMQAAMRLFSQSTEGFASV